MPDLGLRPRPDDGARAGKPHPHGSLSALAANLPATFRSWVARSRGRQALQALAEHNDRHLLEDIGVTREQALRTAAKRFWQP